MLLNLNYELRVRTLTDPVNADNAIAKAEERIRKVLAAKGALKDRALQQFAHANRSGLWIFKQALSNLEDAREVVRNRGHYHLLPREV